MMSSSTSSLPQGSQGPLHSIQIPGAVDGFAPVDDQQQQQESSASQSNNTADVDNVVAPSSAPQRDWRTMTRTIAHYERIEQIGEGTYGQVYRARCKDTDEIVAMKKIRVHHGGYWGMPPTVIREIKILKRLRHPNLVRMVEVVSSKGVEELDEDDEVEEKHKISKNDKVVDAREGFKGNLFLVLEYVSHDLTGLMDVAYKFSEVQVKCIFKQLLSALEYMHENKYVHRDIKSSNILIDHNFRVKLADFGLARSIEPPILDKIHKYVYNYGTVLFFLLFFFSVCVLFLCVFFCFLMAVFCLTTSLSLCSLSLSLSKPREHAGLHQQGDHALVSTARDSVGCDQVWDCGGYLECGLYLGGAVDRQTSLCRQDRAGPAQPYLGYDWNAYARHMGRISRVVAYSLWTNIYRQRAQTKTARQVLEKD
jgi:serine/threonine protein kinase